MTKWGWFGQLLLPINFHNIVQNVQTGVYMVNPMIAGARSFNMRRIIIREYNKLLLEKEKDSVLHYCPRFRGTEIKE